MRALQLTATALLLLFVPPAIAAPPEVAEVKATPLKGVKATPTRDLGTWDDAFMIVDQDFLVLRRGRDLFSLAMTPDAEPKKLRSAAELESTQIIAAVAMGERLWLLLNSYKDLPFALDIRSGDVVRLEVRGIKEFDRDHAPGIQSHVIAPHAGGAILMVHGGKPWPRDGNRPLYFWFSLASGKLTQLPTGWDLDYCSADQQLAVFAAVSEDPFQRRPLRAVALRTAEVLAAVPDRRKELFAPFDWSDTDEVRALYSLRPETGDTGHFAGLTYRGKVVPLSVEYTGTHYLAMAKARGDHVGFTLRPEGSGNRHGANPFWIAPLKSPEKVRRIAAGVSDFTLLDGGNVLFVTTGHGHKQQSQEAWFLSDHGFSRWNVLDDLERLPPLEKPFAEADFVYDQLHMGIVPSFGRPGPTPLVLCLASHQRHDRRAQILVPGVARPKRLESDSWQQTLLVTSDGKRYLTPGLPDADTPDRVWLHHSGQLVVGKFTWQGEEKERTRHLELTGLAFEGVER